MIEKCQTSVPFQKGQKKEKKMLVNTHI
jgi:hypothetical protein